MNEIINYSGDWLPMEWVPWCFLFKGLVLMLCGYISYRMKSAATILFGVFAVAFSLAGIVVATASWSLTGHYVNNSPDDRVVCEYLQSLYMRREIDPSFAKVLISKQGRLLNSEIVTEKFTFPSATRRRTYRFLLDLSENKFEEEVESAKTRVELDRIIEYIDETKGGNWPRTE